MKTNKITVTMIIEIEDNRSLATRCWCPITKELILQNIHIGSGDNLTSKENIISFEETNPLTVDDIRINTDMIAIEDAICFSRVYMQLNDTIENWNWRQDCSK